MKNPTFSILKALAIICVVLSHAAAPAWLNKVVFTFHVPAFFICAGYFFSTKYLSDERTYVLRRIKGLYVPFVKWSLFFLLVHNLLFPLGLLSETVGNAAGGVLHPYNWHTFVQNAWSIVCNMSGYDQFLCGAFWFFRALLIASVAYLLLFKLIRKMRPSLASVKVGWTILALALLAAIWHCQENFRLTGIAQGGYRELMGIFFMSVGFLFRRYERFVAGKWQVAAVCALVLGLFSQFLPSSMAHKASIVGCLSLIPPALSGFYLLYAISSLLARTESFVKRGLVFIGNNTLYVFAFHLLAFKAVSPLKILYYDLPWAEMGAHPSIRRLGVSDGFFLLYTLAGVAFPLLWIVAYRYLKARYGERLKQVDYVGILLNCLRLFVQGCKALGRAVKRMAIGFVDCIKGIIEASNPKEE